MSEQADTFPLRYSGCDTCPVIQALNSDVRKDRVFDIDCADHAVIGIREIRAEVRQEWQERGVRFGTSASPLSVRTGELSESLALLIRARMGSLVSEGVSDEQFHAALIACSQCVTPFEINVNR